MLHARVENTCKFFFPCLLDDRCFHFTIAFSQTKYFLLYFILADVQLRLNREGGTYDNGRALPAMYRERVLDLYHDGFGKRQIAREIRSSPGFVQKVIDRYNEHNTSLRSTRVDFPSPKIDEQVLEYIEVQKLTKPSAYSAEIQQRLLLDGVVHPANLPSVSQINKVIRKELVMTRKKITTIPAESTTPEATAAVDNFLTEIANINPTTLHFFDECSVIKTTGNRSYGSAPLGQAAFEIQRYASNANFTVNLLHSFCGVDFYNILDGPSNGLELLNFFDEVLQEQRADGSAVLERGDCVVMDNCGFHHGHRIEPVLRGMLADCGVRLIFQPPYSPHFNTCEYCFNEIKAFLRRHQMLAVNETKIAIAQAMLNITTNTSYAYFKHCGYL